MLSNCGYGGKGTYRHTKVMVWQGHGDCHNRNSHVGVTRNGGKDRKIKKPENMDWVMQPYLNSDPNGLKIWNTDKIAIFGVFSDFSHRLLFACDKCCMWVVVFLLPTLCATAPLWLGETTHFLLFHSSSAQCRFPSFCSNSYFFFLFFYFAFYLFFSTCFFSLFFLVVYFCFLFGHTSFLSSIFFSHFFLFLIFYTRFSFNHFFYCWMRFSGWWLCGQLLHRTGIVWGLTTLRLAYIYAFLRVVCTL